MKRVSLLLAILFSLDCFGQVKNWVTGFSVTQGINRTFIRNEGQESLLGYSYDMRLFYRFQKRGSGIFIEPSLWFGKNTLRARATDDLNVNMRQFGLGIQASGGVLIAESTYLKVGVLGHMTNYPLVEVVSETGLHLGHSAFHEHFNPRPFLAAMTFGVGGSPGGSRMLELHLTIHQYLTPALLEPYVLDALPSNDKEIFNAKALSTVLLGGMTFKFVRPKKVVEE